MSRLGVEYVVGGVDPESGQLIEDVDHLVSLEIVNENVWHPQVLDKLEVHRHHYVGVVRVINPRTRLLASEFRIEMNPFFRPLDVEVARERDGVVFVVDSQHLVDINGDGDVVDALLHREFELGVVLGQTGQLVPA